MGAKILPEVKQQAMPNAKILSEKKAIVEALTERFQNASAGVFVDYRGITVAEDTQLRRELVASEVEYSVVKNTLTRFALEKAGLTGMDGVLNGTTSLATSAGDPIAPIRIISDYSKKMGDRFNIKAAFMEGKILSEAEIAQLASLTSKKDLYAQLVGTLMAPMANLAAVVNAIAEKGESAE